MSSNALSRIGIIKEVVPGTTPATPQLATQRFSSANFSITKPELLDDSKANTRQYLYTQTGNITIAGSIEGAFAFANYDTLLESCFYKEFASDTLIFGNTIVSLTIEEAQPDTNIYKVSRGCIVNGFTLNSPVSGLTTISFDLLGLSQDINSSSISVASYTPAASSQPFLHCSGTIKEGGTAIAVVTDLNVSVSNNLETVHTWGNCSPYTLVPARVDVSGTLTAILQDTALINKFNNNTATSLEFTLEDNNNQSYTFKLPNIKFTSADSPIDTGSGLRTVSLPFRALFDPTENSTMVIIRDDGL